ncbi:MAG: 4Fe-4S cluster-binding domain-containing protein [Planctomycetes bacterium]|nr:4Fe-4S cluster-binding domain-containing protein [Planctomycetota bacterium]
MVLPCEEKLESTRGIEVADFVDDRNNMPGGPGDCVIQKYQDRVLFLMTEKCFGHCMFCFRQDVLEEKHRKLRGDTLKDKIERLITHVAENASIQEVIISGGDPLTCSMDHLEFIINEILSRTAIRNIRIHSRALVYQPGVITEELATILKKNNIRLVHHIAHPYEICDKVRVAAQLLESTGVAQYNQFTLLRGINDHHEVLLQLMDKLDSMNIRNLSVFFPDPVLFSSTFRLNFSRIFDIVSRFNWNSPSWANAIRFCQDSVHGKVRVEDLVEYIPEKGYALFKREDKLIKVPDLPKKLDIPGEISTLLWKG